MLNLLFDLFLPSFRSSALSSSYQELQRLSEFPHLLRIKVRDYKSLLFIDFLSFFLLKYLLKEGINLYFLGLKVIDWIADLSDNYFR